MIRRYPELLAQAEALKLPPMTAQTTGLPHGGRVSDPTAAAALRELPPVNRLELEAVRAALEETRRLPDGDERIEMIRLVFWSRTHTLAGAALRLHRGERTVREWHRTFIRLAAKKYGLL